MSSKFSNYVRADNRVITNRLRNPHDLFKPEVRKEPLCSYVVTSSEYIRAGINDSLSVSETASVCQDTNLDSCVPQLDGNDSLTGVDSSGVFSHDSSRRNIPSSRQTIRRNNKFFISNGLPVVSVSNMRSLKSKIFSYCPPCISVLQDYE